MHTSLSTSSLLSSVIRRLGRAFDDVRRNASAESFGHDRVTLREFVTSWRKHEQLIKEQLRSGEYQFTPLRGVVVRKDPSAELGEGNVRPISIPAIRDRVVQRAMLAAMWTRLRDFVHTPVSFGGIREYRTRRVNLQLPSRHKSVRLAIERIELLRSSGHVYVFESDIRDFFPSVNRPRLLADLSAVLKDPSIDWLLERAVNVELGNIAELGKYGKLWEGHGGIPQGSVLSPILANFYLYPFDEAIRKAGLELVRYVDDLVILSRSRDDSLRAYELALAELGRLGLSAHALDVPDSKGRVKTQIRNPGEPFTFLGTRFFKSTLQPDPAKFERLFLRIDELTCVDPRAMVPLEEVIRHTNAVVRGWVGAYSHCNISEDDLEKIDRRARDRISGWLLRHGFTENRNVVDRKRATLLGLASASSVPIKPIRVAVRG